MHARAEALLTVGSTSRPRVLVPLGGALVKHLADALPGVDVVVIPPDGDLPPDAHGDVLLTLPWGSPNLGEALARGVRWVHVLGTGIDAFPVDVVGEQVLTCSRGASAIPIAEWVLAVMRSIRSRCPTGIGSTTIPGSG